ncbi:MAG: acyl-CoA transferase [Alphaproteobacteria bacterium]|nr:acyl-CoA transferase [Alphaproteobacteria bacterium]
MTTRETILKALFAALQTISGPKILRNDPLPERIPPEGLLILRDGDPGEPETMLSPLSYYWEHSASLEIFVQALDGDTRNQTMGALFQEIAAVLSNDPTLGGLCDRVTPQAPDTDTLAIEGAPSVQTAIVPIELIYVTASQLG